jgi:NAD(P)-dependent dehydrogenase (short-subunit alcohol dehydrogenase family)
MTVTMITGANSGIGRATALRLAAEGHDVYAGMRSLDKGAKLMDLAGGHSVTPVEIDVADDASVQACADQVLAAAGHVDVLVNNAGVGMNATTEDIDIAAAQAVMNVNVWGAVRCTQAFAPQMRERGSGHVVNITSIAGLISAIGQTVYVGSKFAFEGMSECLAQELAPFGVKVSIIEPGVTRTAILPKNEGHPTPTAYADAYNRMFEFYAAGIAANVGADVVADTIYEALTTDEHRLRWTCAWGGDEIAAGRRAMSDEAWVELGIAATDPAAYHERFKAGFGLDIAPSL